MTRVHDCVCVMRHSCLAERSSRQKSLGGEKADFVVGRKSYKTKLPIHADKSICIVNSSNDSNF